MSLEALGAIDSTSVGMPKRSRSSDERSRLRGEAAWLP